LPYLLVLLQSGFSDYSKHSPISPYNYCVRIIAGKLKGREINVPRGSKIRPATGAIRETVMNLYGDNLAAGPFVDICAGSGLVGFEALSRGAPHVVFVEADRATASRIKYQAKEFGVADAVSVLCLDGRRCFKGVQKALKNDPPMCIFLDPPYIIGMAGDLLGRLGRHSSVIDQQGMVIIRAMEKLPTDVPGLRHESHREAGRHWIYTYSPNPDPGDTTP